MRLGLRQQPQEQVRPAERVLQPSGDPRLTRHLGGDGLAGTSEDLLVEQVQPGLGGAHPRQSFVERGEGGRDLRLGRAALAASRRCPLPQVGPQGFPQLLGVHAPQHVGEKRRHLLRRLPLAVGAIALQGDPPRLERHADRERDQECSEPTRQADSEPVPPEVLPGAVGHARRPCHHRLVPEVPSDVEGELVRGGVAAVPLLLQRLHGDGVEISLELMAKGARVGLPVSRRLSRRVAQRAQPGARAGRLDLLQLSAELLQAGRAKVV